MTLSSVLQLVLNLSSRYLKKSDGSYHRPVAIIALALAYVIAGKLSYFSTIPPGYAPVIWPPAGIALAGLLIYGYRIWPGVLLGALIINGLIPELTGSITDILISLLTTLVISTGATLQALAGAYWLKRYAGFPNGLRLKKAVLLFILYGAALSATINSSLSVALLVATGKIPLANALNDWLSWWTGDLLGILIFTPMTLAWLLKNTNYWRHRRLAITLPTLMMFALTAAAVAYEADSSNQRIQLEFDQHVEELNNALKDGLINESHALHALKNLFITSKAVNREEFKFITEQLATDYQNIQAFSWVPLIQNADKNAFEKTIQKQVDITFKINELDANEQPVRAKERDHYTPVTFIEPYQINKKALGFDISSSPERLTALNIATDSGALAISARVKLIQDDTQGALVIIPLYRSALPIQTLAEKRLAISGYVIGVLRLNDVVTTALKHIKTNDLAYRLIDSFAPLAEQLLYSSDEPFPEPLVIQEKAWFSAKKTLSSRITLPFGGRTWLFEVTPKQDYFAWHRSGYTELVLLLGLLLTSLVSLTSLVASGRARWLQQLINKSTEELKQQHKHTLLLLHEKEKQQTLLLAAKEDIERAEYLANSKSQFLSNMSHELRTPMTAIIGFSDLAMHEEVPPQTSEYLHYINTASKHLLAILNDILDVSKLEAGQMTLQLGHFKLTEIQTTLHGLFIHAAQTKGLTLTIDIETKVPNALIGDSQRLRQILINLLGNAIKFTQQGSVTLNISLQQLDDQQARLLFAVTDTGMGISAEQQAKLFLPFSQVDEGYARNFEGTGLGLSISQSFVQLMGANIMLDSDYGLGSCFSFELELPLVLATIEPKLTPTITQNSEALSGVRVLVAEDDEFIKKIINAHLKRVGASIVLVNNGLEALAALDQQSFDIVLMDLHMPDMDGYETTVEIRKQARYAQLPVIAFSASIAEDDKRRCLASGMNGFVIKPINISALLATFKQHLNQ